MTDIVERLNAVAQGKIDAWKAETLSVLCTDAIAEIMRLRTQIQDMQSIMGVAALGPSFAEIREQAKAQDHVEGETRR